MFGTATVARFERLVEINHHMPYAEIGAILSLNLMQTLNLGPSECHQRYVKFLSTQWN